MNNSPSRADQDKDDGGGVVKLPGVTIPVPRTFRALDGLLARPLEHLEEYLDKKRAENITAHAKAVEDANPSAPKQDLSVQQVELLALWVEKASSFSEEDEELASAWRAALERIKANDPYSSKIITALSMLSTPDIVDFICSIPKHVLDASEKGQLISSTLEGGAFCRLDTKGMAQTTINDLISAGLIYSKFYLIVFPILQGYILLIGALSLFYLIAHMFIVWVGVNLSPEVMVALKRMFDLMTPVYEIVIGGLTISVIIEIISRYQRSYFPSPIGISFIKSFQKYYKIDDNQDDSNPGVAIKKKKKNSPSKKT